MAQSPALVKSVSTAFDKNPETVKVALRRLREAKLVDVKGKGRGGKDMTSRDAAMLVLGLTGGGQLKDSLNTIEAYWNLLPARTVPGPIFRTSPTKGRPLLNDRYLGRLFASKLSFLDSFGVTLTGIIDHAVNGTLFPLPGRTDYDNPPPDFPPHADPDLMPYLTVRIISPVKTASIHFGINRQWHYRCFFGQPISEGGIGLHFEPPTEPVRSEYIEIKQLSEVTILTIAEGLR